MDLKWIARLILKDLKLGLGHETVLKMFHPKSLDVFNATSDLKQVFVEVDSYDMTKTTGIYKVFFPIKPMLAGKLNLDMLAEFVRHRGDALSGVCVETKFDGERIQCHFCDGVVMFFSRNSHDVTSVYADKLSLSVKEAISPDVRACVMDGEVIVWDNEENCAAQFGKNKAIANEEFEDPLNSRPRFVLKYKVFDLLYYQLSQDSGV